jgi:hypothetical protein
MEININNVHPLLPAHRIFRFPFAYKENFNYSEQITTNQSKNVS